MIVEYEKFRIPDENKNNDWFVEVNWDGKEENKECKILKVTFPDGVIRYIKREHLMAILFAIGRPEDQQKMIPQKLTHVRWYETVVSVKAKNDIRKGEKVTFPIKISLPARDEEVIGPVKKGSGLYVPRS